MEIAFLARHGQSVLNVESRVNGDPARDLGLSELGREEGRKLAGQLTAVTLDLCVVSRFPRAQETAELALGGRSVPWEVDGDLDDIRIGALEGKTIADYEAWKAGRPATSRFRAARASTTRRAGTPTRSSGCSDAPSARSSSSATRSPCATR